MNEHEAVERRVAALIRAYADRAPVDVDPMAITRLVAAGSRGATSLWFVPAGRGLAITLVLLALLVTIAAGALIAGALPFRRDPVEILTNRAFVEPFTEFPPEGAAPSTPETGQLVLSFYGRISSIGMDVHRVWAYADGRLIWKRNNPVNEAGRQVFGTTEPTTAVIEQRLAPEGVELLRSRAMAAGLHGIRPLGPDPDRIPPIGPGVLWGGLVVWDGEQLVEAGWSDSELPAVLADPASWMPATAWADRRIGAYVPSRYAVCLGHGVPAGATAIAPSGIWELLPEHIRNLIRSRALEDPIPDWNERDDRCLYQVSTDDALAITAALDDAGVRRDPESLTYTFPTGLPAGTGEGMLQLLVVLPNGEVVCYCG